MSVTVVIPTHNRHAGLAALLDDLARQTGAAEAEVLVVDSPEGADCSHVVEAAAGRGLNVRLLSTENSQAAKRNLGAAVGTGELLITLDDDMRVPDGWLAAHVASHADGAERCVSGDVVFPRSWVRASNFYRYKQGQHRNGSDELTPIPPHRIVTMNLSIPRATWLRTGGNDLAFKRYGGEDIEFGFRLAEAGVPLVLSTAAWAWHCEVKIDVLGYCRKFYGSAYDGAPLVVAKAPAAANVRTFRWSEPGMQTTASDRVAHRVISALARPGIVVGLARALQRTDRLRPLYSRVVYRVLTALVMQLGVDDRTAGVPSRARELFG